MTLIITTFIFTSLFIFGLHAITRAGQLLAPVHDFLLPVLGEKWIKPVINCPKCMPSVWGTVSFFALWFSGVDIPFAVWPAWCIALSGFNVLIDKFSPY